MSLGHSLDVTKDLEDRALTMAMTFQHLGLSTEVFYKTVIAIKDTMGFVVDASDKLLENISLLSSNFGVAQGVSVDFLKSLSMITGGTIETNKEWLGIAQRMAEASGVGLDDVMKDISSSFKKFLPIY